MITEALICLGILGIALLIVSLAIMCVIPQEELRRAANKREYEKAVRDLYKHLNN